MASNYKKYLAEKVISDQEHVTYRALSRALNVHCNHAKRMLFDFHSHENSKKPRSVNATYLITGVLDNTPLNPQAHGQTRGLRDGDDEVMQSSPFVSSQVVPDDESGGEDDAPVPAVLLVREDEVDDVKRRMKMIHSIFIYSVQATAPADLNALADITSLISREDPLKVGGRLGMILNGDVKRRTGAVPPPPAPVAAPKPKIQKPTASIKQEEQAKGKPKTIKQEIKPEPKLKTETESRPASRQSQSQSQSNPQTQTQTQKAKSSRNTGPDLFKAFAKAKAKPKTQIKKEESATGTNTDVDSAEPSVVEDVPMNDTPSYSFSDDDEQEPDASWLDAAESSHDKKREREQDTKGESRGETRRQREERLRRMMDDDDDDEDMPDATQTQETPSDLEEEEEEEEQPPTNPPSNQPDPTPEQDTEPPSAQPAPKRRRAKRRVTKKKTFKDAHGYLVTKEEAVWESFSEDEPVPEPPATKKKQVLVKGAAGKSTTGGKGSAGQGQGSIMSFFGKKG